MGAYLRPLVPCCLYTTIIRLKRKILKKSKKSKRYRQNNVYARIANGVYVCVNYNCILRCIR